MVFLNELVDSLPPLAWLFTSPEVGKSRLVHGSAVDVFEDGFFEGCLAGNTARDLTQIQEVFGSGMKIQNGEYVFITPSHTLESIFVHRRGRDISLSNSLPFLLEFHEITLPWDPHYARKLASICLGIDAYEKELIEIGETQILRLTYDNVVIGPKGKCELRRKLMPPPFKTYSDYVAYLEGTLRQAFANAARDGRATAYHPLATCSSGYDSVAAAALAQRSGCREAITLTEGYTKKSFAETDSGKVTGELLGLTVREFENPGNRRLEGGFGDIALFLATGFGAVDYNYKPFAGVLEGRVLLTGDYGDVVWGMRSEPSSELMRVVFSGNSLQEFRLRRNYVLIPVPFIGSRRGKEIWKISHASEMEPYTLHTDYDRPIPRRILEERGVPREVFGQRKKYTSTVLKNPLVVRGRIRSEYEAFAAKLNAPRTKYRVRGLGWKTREAMYRAVSVMEKFLPALGSTKRSLIGESFPLFMHSRPGESLEICVALAAVQQTYRAELSNSISITPERKQ